MAVTEQNIKLFSEQCKNIFEQIGRDVIGQREVIEGAVIAMIAGGNVLLEGVPGVGKTRLVRSLSQVLSLPFARIQFTPDLMPSDITGTEVFSKDESGNMKNTFRQGPIFANLVLADEINRATPKTQAAMLEAMGEVEITTVSGGVSFAGNADELTLDAVNGDLTVNGDIGELEIHAVEGKVTFTGGVRTADVDCANTDITMYLDMATELSFDQVDGDVHLYLSEEIKGFSAELDAISGEISVEGFDVSSVSNKSARWGDGSLRIEMDGVGFIPTSNIKGIPLVMPPKIPPQ